MPRKTDTTAINCPFLDRRTKLLPCQKEMIKYYHDQGATIRGLARQFNVDKRLIQFVIYPERRIKNVADRKSRIGSTLKEYGNKYFADSIKAHRDYKKSILKGKC